MLTQLFYCDEFVLPLPEGHRFPMAKYRRLRERLVGSGLLVPGQLRVPDAATDAQLRRVHTAAYVDRVRDGLLDPAEVRRLGFPWSPQLVERSRRSVGGTVAACRAALAGGIGVNLAGGTHHAFADRGEGYCVFNDAAVAARAMQAEEGVVSAAVVDCDVHQGNGTAAIFADDSTVATYSIHGRGNFPFRKESSDVDVALPDGTGDREYLQRLTESLAPFLDRFRPQLVIYVAGADAWRGDRLGRLALSKDGLESRDRLVLDLCGRRGVPVAVVMAGGYAPDVEDIAEIHARTVAAGLEAARHPARVG